MNEREIFLTAHKIAQAEERESFLESACRGDRALYERVLDLLSSADGVGSFLESPAPALVAALDPRDETQASGDGSVSAAGELQAGTLGDYRILEEIGRGGMGVVYEAEQVSLGRRVALKVLSSASILDKTKLERFKIEARAAASLDHPNVVHVHSVGSQRGVHYYAMQFIEGQTVEDVIADKRRRRGLDNEPGQLPAARGSSRNAPTEEHSATEPDAEPVPEAVKDTSVADRTSVATRGSGEEREWIRRAVKLAIQAAEALEHAHRMGIVHRDIKPSNLLVDGEQHLWVADFGLAMIEAEGKLTATGSLLGTFRYMSPEQIRGDRHVLDHHTDIYSLGATLYEMLTLRRAFPENDPTQLLQQIPVDEPTAPRKLNGAISRDLETIVLKAMAKGQEDRYSNAAALAEDLRHFLEDEPIAARPPGPLVRAKKWAKRHRAVVATAMSTITIAAFIVGGLLWNERHETLAAYEAGKEQRRIAIENENAARSAEESARRAQAKANQRSALARRAVDEMYTQFAEDWLAQEGALTEVQNEFLEKALAFYEVFSEESEEDLASNVSSLRALERVAAIQSRFGRHAKAEASFEQLIVNGQALLQEHGPEQEVQLILASTRNQLARMLRSLGRIEEAERHARSAYTNLQAVDVSQLEDEASRRYLATTANSLCGTLTEAGDVDDAAKSIGLCMQTWQSLLDEDPLSWKNRLGQAQGYCRLGMHRMWWGGKNKEAEEAFHEAEARLSMLLKERPRDRNCRQYLGSCLWNRATICRWENRNDEAQDLRRETLKIKESLAADFPSEEKMQSDLASAISNLEEQLWHADPDANQEEVEKLCRRRVTLARKLVENYPDSRMHQLEFGRAANRLVYFLWQSSVAEALTASDEVHQRMTQLLQNASKFEEVYAAVQDATRHLQYRAALLLELGRYVDAAQTLDLALPRERLFNPNVQEDLDTIEELHGREQVYLQILERCEYQVEALGRTAFLYRKCADAAKNDPSLALKDQERLIAGWETRHDAYQAEADRAYDAWKQHLVDHPQFQSGRDKYVYYWCKKRCKAADETLKESGCDLEREYHRSHELRMCRAVIEQGINLYPLDKSMHWTVGFLVAGPEELHDGELAIQIARQVLKDDPKNGLAEQNLGWALFRAGRWQECLDLAGPEPDDLQPDRSRCDSAVIAMSLCKLGRRTEAATWLAEGYRTMLEEYREKFWQADAAGIDKYPDIEMLDRLDREAREMLGDDPEKLIEAYYGESHPDDPVFLAERGMHRYKNGLLEEAVQDLTALLKLRPEIRDAEIWKARGDAKLKLMRPEESIADLSKAIELDSKDKNALNLRAWAHITLGQLDLALADRNRIVELDPSQNDAYFKRAVVHRRLGNFDLALSDIKKGLEIDPSTDSVWYPRSRAHWLAGSILYEDLGRAEEAIQAFTQAIVTHTGTSEKSPNLPDLYRQRAVAHEQLGHRELAEQDYARAEELTAGLDEEEIARSTDSD